jgi:rhodanese-related sulfurtransferase
MVATISPTQLADLRRRGESVTLIDVRTPAEFGEVHVEGARNIPLDRLDAQAVTAAHGGSGPVYFICRSGGRSSKACEKMSAHGLADVVSVEGGTAAAESAGLPVIRGRKVMSLERQVRIAAGGLVALGAALAAFAPDETLRNVGLGLAGFVGAGLVFAGVTDTCGMAMLIAKMPWNQACGSGSSCARLLMLAAVLSGLAGSAVAQPAAAPPRHTADSLAAVQQSVAAGQAVLVDVREVEEWDAGHVAGARLLPLSVLEKGVSPEELAKVLPRDRIIYCHCLVGGRCLEAAAILAPLGYDVRPMKSGYPALVKAGFPATVGR